MYFCYGVQSTFAEKDRITLWRSLHPIHGRDTYNRKHGIHVFSDAIRKPHLLF